MGNFFTSTQIYNPNLLDREQFINFFCEEMKKNGYVTSNSDESEVSYILRFSDECKWVTLASEAYEQGNQLSQSDTGRIAKMLKTVCINTTVIDSDCATLDLYDKSGKKKDSLIMGRADDYFGDDIPEPIASVWSPLLEKGYSWNQLLEVRNKEYVFVEDGLTKLASVIGIDRNNILFSVKDEQQDEQTVFLDFKKTDTKKEKKLTLNAAFKQIFGEGLEPFGFRKVKSKYPYYVRMINEEIFHVITLFPKASGLRGKKAFEVYGGVGSIYRAEIDFSINPSYDTLWMCSNYTLYREYHLIPQHRTKEEKEILRKLGCFYYEAGDTFSLLNSLKIAYDFSKQYLFPCIDNVTNIDKMIEYFYKHTSVPLVFEEKFEGLIFLKADNFYKLIEEKAVLREEKYKIKLELQKHGYDYGCSQEEYESIVRERETLISKEIVPIEEVLNSPELFSKYNEILAKRKYDNTNKLRHYGLLNN